MKSFAESKRASYAANPCPVLVGSTDLERAWIRAEWVTIANRRIDAANRVKSWFAGVVATVVVNAPLIYLVRHFHG